VPGAPSLWHKTVTAGAAIALAVTPAFGAPGRIKPPAAKTAPPCRQGRAPRPAPGAASWLEWIASDAIRP